MTTTSTATWVASPVLNALSDAPNPSRQVLQAAGIESFEDRAAVALEANRIMNAGGAGRPSDAMRSAVAIYKRMGSEAFNAMRASR